MSLPPVEILPAGFFSGLDLPQRGLSTFLPDAMGENKDAVVSEKSEKPIQVLFVPDTDFPDILCAGEFLEEKFRNVIKFLDHPENPNNLLGRFSIQ
jgi:hypothetical protein